MCGIVGGFGLSVNETWVLDQSNVMHKRGPDFQAAKRLDSFAVVGAARLAMTDPEPRSHQPLASNHLNSVIVFNGEIYNYKHLRAKLMARGYEFYTESDTEVLLSAIHAFGTNVAAELNGMYAYAYYDLSAQTLQLGRDRYGKKPLYFSEHNGNFYWSSSFKSLSHLIGSNKIDDDTVKQFLSLGYAIDPKTFESNISALLPGNVMRVKMDLGQIKTESFSNLENLRIKVNSTLEFRKLIETATLERISGHQEVAVSLSGGLDSSIIAMLARKSCAKVKAFSLSWQNSDKDRYNTDSKSASRIAKNLGIEFEIVDSDPAKNLKEYLIEYVSAMEEPNSNPTGVSMLDLYSRISTQGFRLVLTGDGADEILGGYPRYASIGKVPNLGQFKNLAFLTMAGMRRTPRNHKFINGLISQLHSSTSEKWMHWHMNFSFTEVADLLGSPSEKTEVRNILDKSIRGVSNFLSSHDIENCMEKDRLIWLPMESNRKLDRISMFNSIEARSPFQDDEVISAAVGLMADSHYKQLNKSILIETFPEMAKIGVRDDKAGFISPVGHWLRSNPEVVNMTLAILEKNNFPKSKTLRQLIDAPKMRNYRKIMQLWSLVVFAFWLEFGRQDERI
ncbi:MAG: asparagine synthase (glutamine-hydrolyzing) [Bacteroidetes bacterium]|nr:asparagine synthase (glutamine-hydrolyzing) [bacterium]NBP65800.1 asparagine synthase (glutamine-hydrolyzing) [Bacteroidota bacterium]